MASRWPVFRFRKSSQLAVVARDKKKDRGREDAKRGGRGEGGGADDKFARIGRGWLTARNASGRTFPSTR